jgi:hypothetical protein
MSINIEKMFQDDIREKKKAGSGSFHKRGKGVRHGLSGALRTPSYFMKQKEKNKLSGEVRSYNMFENTILSLEDFNSRPLNVQRDLMTAWRENFTNKDICASMEMTVGRFNKLVKDLDIPMKEKTGGRTKKTAAAVILKEGQKGESIVKEKTPPAVNIEKMDIPILDGLSLSYTGQYSPENLVKVFDKLSLLLSDEKNKFEVSISIQECKK